VCVCDIIMVLLLREREREKEKDLFPCLRLSRHQVKRIDGVFLRIVSRVIRALLVSASSDIRRSRVESNVVA
jgi:hypothetical protein